ncbi:hypothetical protein ACYUJ6_10060 [Clostridium sp. JNZ X4-2]
MISELSKIYMEEGFRNLQQKKLNTAEDNFQKAIVMDNKNWQAVNLYGLCLYTSGHFEKAGKLWKNSIGLNSKENNRAYYYIKSLQENEFIVLCNLYDKSLKYARNGNFKKADEIMEKIEFNNCKIIPFINFKGLCNLALDKKNKAMILWKQSLLINKENEDTLNYIINSCDQKRKYKFLYNILGKILKNSE